MSCPSPLDCVEQFAVFHGSEQQSSETDRNYRNPRLLCRHGEGQALALRMKKLSKHGDGEGQALALRVKSHPNKAKDRPSPYG